jgi:hypothetical protein
VALFDVIRPFQGGDLNEKDFRYQNELSPKADHMHSHVHIGQSDWKQEIKMSWHTPDILI